MVEFMKNIRLEIIRGYMATFNQKWPSWLGGLLIGIVALMIFIWNFPWGIAAGYQNWGEWVYFLSGMSDAIPEMPWLHTLSVSNFGIFFGALASALLSRQFVLRKAPRFEYVKGAAGGILMGAGAALAGGCNVGGFYTAVGVFSMGGYAMMMGLFIGAFIGLKYLVWEMEHLSHLSANTNGAAEKSSKRDWSKIQPAFGILVLIGCVAAFYVYSAFDQTKVGGLLFFGMLIGMIMHRSRFCFARAFREPFMTGEADMVRAVAVSLAVFGFGSAVIKWSWIQPPQMGVYHPFWIGSFVGGLIFGIGMLLAGGCASSTLWRAAEGNSKLMVTLISLALTYPATHSLLEASGFKERLGHAFFMPEVISWSFAIPVFLFILIVWVLMAEWNEQTEKLVIL